MHLFDAGLRFYGGNAIVAGGLPLAVGLALADKMRNQSRITLCIFGDGAVAEGAFHESMNLAALWQLPVLFLCENNLYAMGTALDRHQSQTDVSRKADAYNMASSVVDGMDVAAVEGATREAVSRVRGGSPCLLEARTYRFRAHSMYDAELYREKSEVEEWKKRCPIANWTSRLRDHRYIDDATLATLEAEVQQEVATAVAEAEAGPWEPIADLTKDVYTSWPR